MAPRITRKRIDSKAVCAPQWAFMGGRRNPGDSKMRLWVSNKPKVFAPRPSMMAFKSSQCELRRCYDSGYAFCLRLRSAGLGWCAGEVAHPGSFEMFLPIWISTNVLDSHV
jgi:hypothetical protein